MDLIEKNESVPSTSKLSKLGVTAVGYTAAGVGLFVLQFFARFRGLGIIVGVIVCLLGIGSLISKDQEDKKAGFFITAAGALTLLSKIPVLAPLAATLLSIGAVGLLTLGIVNGIKFLFGLKKRS